MSENLTYSAFESRYRDKKYIGAGGFGKVFKVFDHAKNHYVALKVADVRPEWNKFTLKNEVELVNKMTFHRNIARYDACYRFNTGITGEMDFAILKFYEYGNLEQFLTKEDLSIDDKRLIVQGVLKGISFLHQNDVIHRDIKAQNILLSREDGVWTPKITDFGLSRKILDNNTITNSAIGLSYSYAAPEQILNKKIDKNVDLWAVGVVIYRIMADELPFKGRVDKDGKSTQSQLELTRKIVNMELPEKLNTIPEPYQAMIRRCLVFEPKERANSSQELLDILKGTQVRDSEPYDPRSVFESKIEDATVVVDPNLKKDIEQAPDVKENVQNDSKSLVTPAPVEPPAYKASGKDYSVPNINPTIIVDNPNSGNKSEQNEIEEPKPVEKYTPKTGVAKSKNKVLWVVLPLVFLVLLYGVWQLGKGEPQTNETNAIQETDENAIIEIDPIEVVKEETDGSLNSLLASSELEKDDPEALNKINELLLDISQKQTKNYRVNYLLAKNYSILGKSSRKVIAELNRATKIAIDNGHAKSMLLDLTNDKENSFEGLSKARTVKYLNSIEQALSSAE